MWEESFYSSSSSISKEISPCLLCACGTKSRIPIDKPNHHESTHQQMFNYFCKILGMKEPSKIWNFENEKVFPFCAICKALLNTLVEVYSKLEELERVIKARMNEGEKTFVGDDLYGKCDERYLKFRKEAREGNVMSKSGETLGEIFTSDSESELGALSNEPKGSVNLQREKVSFTSTTKQRRKRKKTSSDSSTSSSSDSDTSESEFSNKRKKKIAKPTPSQKPNPNLILHSCRLCRDNPGFSSKELFNKHLATTHKVSSSKEYAQMNATLANKNRDGRKRYHTEKGWVTECEICSKQFININCRMSEWKHHQLTHKSGAEEIFLKNMRHGSKAKSTELVKFMKCYFSDALAGLAERCWCKIWTKSRRMKYTPSFGVFYLIFNNFLCDN
ncbi:hypothetical protein Ocin01_18753 [Orchesella cincta]|uniref:Uncharacterized protein n=1 Tax=Orchesella cincta TaxID=48709 RepID=A0A1D2M4N1_ORCCI|nr:hypothetical protein Ocin01_18753 [Orchesella cincta]